MDVSHIFTEVYELHMATALSKFARCDEITNVAGESERLGLSPHYSGGPASRGGNTYALLASSIGNPMRVVLVVLHRTSRRDHINVIFARLYNVKNQYSFDTASQPMARRMTEPSILGMICTFVVAHSNLLPIARIASIEALPPVPKHWSWVWCWIIIC